MILTKTNNSLLPVLDWRAPLIRVADAGTPVTFHLQDVFNYHGYDAVGGVVLGFRLLQQAFAMLSPDTLPERREFALFTAFPGLGARDCFELITRMVTEGRFRLDTGFSDTSAQVGVEGRFHFDFSYRGRHALLTPIAGAPSAEFIELGKASKDPVASPQQKKDWQQAKLSLANTLLAAEPGDVIRPVS